MAFKALIVGDTGVGKTCAIRTLVKAGQKVRFLAAENNAIEGSKQALRLLRKEDPSIIDLSPDQWAVMVPNRPKRSLKDLVANQEKFMQTTLESAMKTVDPNRNKYTRYLEVIKSLVAFKDTETGTDLGNTDDWGEDTTLVIDGLTIICEAIKLSVIGGKQTISQPEWGVMQNILVDILRNLTEDKNCNVVLLAHPDKEVDPIAGTQRIYPANLGKALNSLIPTYFTEVVWAFRKNKEFLWSTQHPQAVTRQTLLPLEAEMKQDFGLMFKH